MSSYQPSKAWSPLPFQLSSPVRCPYCGFEYTHQGDVSVFQRHNDAEKEGLRITAYTGEVSSLPGNLNPSGRRSGIRIEFSCENWHEFTMLIFQDKGITLIEAWGALPELQHPGPLPEWTVAVGRTPERKLFNNALNPRSGTPKQLAYLRGRCRRHGFTESELLYYAILLGRIHPKHSALIEEHPALLEGDEGDNFEGDDNDGPLENLTFDEIGGLFEIVHAWDERGVA